MNNDNNIGQLLNIHEACNDRNEPQHTHAHNQIYFINKV